MKQMFRVVSVVIAATALSACGTKGQAVKPDSTGHLATGAQGQVERAHTVKSEKINIQEFKPLALVTANDFSIQQVRNLGFFTEVIDLAELQRRVVSKNLQDKIPSLSDRIGISNAGRYFGKFLWIHYDSEKRDGKAFIKLVATDPSTLNDAFVAEKELVNPIMTWNGYTDQNTWFPLFNSLIDWLKSN